MKRTTLSLIAAVTALAAVTGFAAVSAPDAPGDTPARAAATLPVERTSLVCPAPSSSDLAETTYTAFTPATEGTGDKGTAQLLPATGDSADKPAKSVLTPKEPAAPVGTDRSGADAPPLAGTAEGRLAPGWAVQQTTEVAAGVGRGLQGLGCVAPDTDFWFPGAATDADRTDYVHLVNPDDSAAVVDIELYGKDGALESEVGSDITVKALTSEPVLLSTLTDEELTDLTVHVNVRSGRVGAAVQALDEKRGGDWLTASADPADSLVMPGIPEDATAVRLIAYSTGGSDADLKLRLASPSGSITPVGNETVHVKAGMTTAVDLGDITKGEPGSLVLTPSGTAVPVVAALQVVRGKGDDQETAYIPAARSVDTRATAIGNTEKGTGLALTAPSATTEVKVTASAGTEGGEAASETFTIKSGTTQKIELPVPSGLKGTYALTVEPTGDGGPLYASRTLTTDMDGVPAFTVQTLPDDRGRVSVPEAEQDLSVLQDRVLHD
ncbi:DUF5719 family protein [Streptomyces sp. NPDC091377]|uniref:DUF5719 family protein n=1 Tax=Streptomyces sp. NPDC091377 TaxID=3365995 RepID=UPI00380631F7